jgi:hypothetical protein
LSESSTACWKSYRPPLPSAIRHAGAIAQGRTDATSRSVGAAGSTRAPSTPLGGADPACPLRLIWRLRANHWRGIANPAQALQRLKGRHLGFAPEWRRQVCDFSPLACLDFGGKPTRAGPRVRPLLTSARHDAGASLFNLRRADRRLRQQRAAGQRRHMLRSVQRARCLARAA